MSRNLRARRLVAIATGTAALLSTTIAGTLTGALTGPTAAVPGVPAGTFDANSVGWYSYSNQSSTQFASTFNALKRQHLPVDIDVETAGGYRVGSVWQQNLDGRSWKEKRDLTDAQFHAEWEAAKNAGMRLVEQETYVKDGGRRYAGIWVQNKEGSWASHRGQTNAQFVASFKAHRDAGLMPVDYDEYLTSDGVRYSSVWVKTPARTGWKLFRGQTSAQFSSTFDANKATYRMLAFDTLRAGSSQRYAGIWITNSNHRRWAERRDMSATSYANYWHRYADQGYRVVSFDRYQTANGTRYAAIWRQNSARPDWSLKTAVDNRVQQEISSTTVPGISVAVYQNATPVYLRGFGYADLGDGIWMDSTHVGSTGSVSKAVGGVLTMRMVEQGLVDLDDETRDWVPTMPAKHTHTVGSLLSNRGCIRHYVSGLDDFADKPYATALAASKEFWDDDLVCDPSSDDEYHYSTHGYTLLGAALEAAGGDDIKDLVRNKLTNPFHLGTLGPQNFSSSVHRMSIYSTDNAEVDTPNNDWKVLGGGIDSSAADLGAFGAKLLGGQILSDSSLTTMWTPPNNASSYAYGWSTGSEDGTPVVAKDGSWTGNLAYLRMYPEKGIVVAVMMNSRWGDQSATGLGRDIGSIVLDSVG
jgi:CubicO group peptidase (beta-lactamase class C family)